MNEKDKEFVKMCSEFLKVLKDQKRHYVLLVSGSTDPAFTQALGTQAIYGDPEMLTYLIMEALLDINKPRETIGGVQ